MRRTDEQRATIRLSVAEVVELVRVHHPDMPSDVAVQTEVEGHELRSIAILWSRTSEEFRVLRDEEDRAHAADEHSVEGDEDDDE